MTAKTEPEPQAPKNKLQALVENPVFSNAVIAVILVNAVALGLETSATVMERWGDILLVIDKACLAVFVAELLVKLAAYRLNFFKSGWNWFDAIIVGVALTPSSGAFSVLRALRILRAFRLISAIPKMRGVIHALLAAIPAMGSVIAILGLIFYVFSVMATKMFGGAFPDWFGSVGAALYTLFQIMTLESWSMGIVRPVMREFPWAWAVFVPFILITTFAVVNLFIAIIVNSMQEVTETELHHQDELIEELSRDVKVLRGEIASLRDDLKRTRPGPD